MLLAVSILVASDHSRKSALLVCFWITIAVASELPRLFFFADIGDRPKLRWDCFVLIVSNTFSCSLNLCVK